MSYILDALRRAEADRERERGRVPGLHTPSQPGSTAAPAPGARRWLPWAGAGLLLLAGVVAGSWWSSGPHDEPPSRPPMAPGPMAVTTPPTQGDRPALGTPPLAGMPMPPPPAASASPYLPPLPPPGTVTAAPVTPAPRTAAAAAPALEAEAHLPKLAELPESTRRDVPKLAISGSVYSEDAPSRFVIINGEVQHEGARLGDDFVLEHIRPRELVLRFRGQRFRQPV